MKDGDFSKQHINFGARTPFSEFLGCKQRDIKLPPTLLDSAQLIIDVDGPPAVGRHINGIDAKSAPAHDKQVAPTHAATHSRSQTPECAPQAWEYSMTGFAEQCVDKYCELANTDSSRLKTVTTPCLDEHHLTPEMHAATGSLAPVAAQIVLKMLWLARNYRYDIYFTVNYLARFVTKWSAACDAMLFHLTCYINSTVHYVQQCAVGDTAEHINIGLFVDANHVTSSDDSVSTGGALMVLYGPNTYVPITAICKRQRRVAHSSTESEMIISLKLVYVVKVYLTCYFGMLFYMFLHLSHPAMILMFRSFLDDLPISSHQHFLNEPDW